MNYDESVNFWTVKSLMVTDNNSNNKNNILIIICNSGPKGLSEALPNFLIF